MTLEEPMTVLAGLHETAVVDDLGLTARLKDPADGGLRASPEYRAVSSAGPIADAGVYVTEQLPLSRVQDVRENLPGLSLDHVTLPLGEFPGTVTLQLEGEPTVTDDLLQDMEGSDPLM
jgi:hypothetical protein